MLQSIGPVMLDLTGTEMTQEEREIIQHPLVGGVILFTRNYENPKQLADLCASLRTIKPLLLAVDHEGGRVQRFRDGFTRLPSMGLIGQWFDQSPDQALSFAKDCAWLMATELLASGLDISFSPVLDLHKTINPAIGDRAFHRKAENVILLAKSWIVGMQQAGMAATGKHFPGHGSVTVDSHIALPVDMRNMAEITQDDLVPFVALMEYLDAIMPAHIVFSSVDDKPVGFSNYWLKTVLKQQYQYSGMIFSDDLNMHGAAFAGEYMNRASAALAAGCDMVLICNNRVGALNIIDHLPQHYRVNEYLFYKMQGKHLAPMDDFKKNVRWRETHRNIMRLIDNESMVI